MSATILVVEDNTQNLYLATYLLESAGYTVLSADDGASGVALARESMPDVVLMDILLPGIDGYEATRLLKSDDATASMTIVALTAYSMEGDEQAALDAGCDGYIAKPIDPTDFVDKVRAFLPGGGSGGVPTAEVYR
jgi:two-component system cell cycle response regulator DivK